MRTLQNTLQLTLVILFTASTLSAQELDIPEPLRAWKEWVLWGERHPDCPTPYNTSEQHICVWPSRLTFSADPQRGVWQVQVRVFEPAWVALPGSAETWPREVRANDAPVPVVEYNGTPAVRLAAGLYEVAGEFRWDTMPQRIAIPKQIGLVSLVVDGQAVPMPNWDASGDLWLKRVRSEAAEKDLLAVQVYRVIEDGIPLWLRTEIDVTVSGKNREEQLGGILPAGWQLSLVESPLPVAVDDAGRMRAQVRAGNWKIQVHAFRNHELEEVGFATDVQPITDVELIGFRAKPEFRIAELAGLQQVNVEQTTYPTRWRELPVYEWNTGTTFQLVEKMRGLGAQRPEGLTIDRHFWLDEDGGGITYRDRIRGTLQQIWRLDVAAGLELGSVRVDGERQLITANPQTDAQGVEIRDRNLKLEALGRISDTRHLSATGWQSDADALSLTFSLPPGWRMFALFGADRVEGDWLTAWSLLDLFLLLIFALAVCRMWGIGAGVVALLAFALSYHEPGAPRLTWLFLLMPLALLRVVTEGSGSGWLKAWRNLAVALLLLNLVPFVARQIQSAIYPQLEPTGVTYRARGMFEWLGVAYETGVRVADYAQEVPTRTPASSKLSAVPPEQNNLRFDPQAKIQTGPAEPEWDWNQVHCVWSGPVSSDQEIVPLLISRTVHRGLTVARLVLLLLLAGIVLGAPRFRFPLPSRRTAVVLAMSAALWTNAARGQIPDQQMLDTLRERLLQPADAYPHAAEMTAVQLTLSEGRVTMQAEIHAALAVAVPLPGRLPSWSPVSVLVDEKPDAAVCRRDDGYLWVNVPQGIHRIDVEGSLGDTTEWEWTYLLRPRRVTIDAPDWEVTGVRPDGVPEDQVLLTRRERLPTGTATYDQKNFRAIVAVERRLEVGLIWKVHTTVTRLSEPGKAVSLKVPLLAGESVLTSNTVVDNATIEVNLGASQTSFAWESELPGTQQIELVAAETSQWVEVWELVTSPVWNVNFTGLAPIFEQAEEKLIPVWHPWPGEGVTLTFRQPQPVQGATLTVQRVQHETTLGNRQREINLTLVVESSLGGDFVIELPEKAEVTSLKVADQATPVHREAARLLVPVRPGEQVVEVRWTIAGPLTSTVSVAAISLPVDGSNVTSVMRVPETRWVLWTDGPLRGPAVRFWIILATAILAALVLSRLALSPLHRVEWMLLMLGLTQVHVAAALLVIGWLLLVAWRGKREPDQMGYWRFNLLQLGLVVLTLIVLGVFIVVVGEGLLGSPEMFILGNGSSRTYLSWFQPLTGPALPEPYVVSVSVWFYRLLMLLWALWLATALLRWLKNGWAAFSHGGCWKRSRPRREPPLAELVES